MKLSFSAAACALLAASVTALPMTEEISLERRDLPTISGVLNTIMYDLVAMDNLVKAFDGNAEKAVPILEAADKTLKDIKEGIPTVKATDELGFIQSIGILLPVGALFSAAKQLVTDIIEKKPQFDSSYTTLVVQDKLGEFQSQAGALVAVTIKKIPAYLSIISTPIAGSITGQLDNAATAYGLQAAPPPEFASLGDAFASLSAALASGKNDTTAAAAAAAPVAAPAPAPAAAAGLGGLSSLFGLSS